MSERFIHQLPHTPQPGTWPATQAGALTGDRTSDPLVHRPVLSPLSHTSQGLILFLNDYFWRKCIPFFFCFYNENYYPTEFLQIEKCLVNSSSALFQQKLFMALLSLVEKELSTSVCAEGHTLAVPRAFVYKCTTPSCSGSPTLGTKIPLTCPRPVTDIHFFVHINEEWNRDFIHLNCLVMENSPKVFPIK